MIVIGIQSNIHCWFLNHYYPVRSEQHTLLTTNAGFEYIHLFTSPFTGTATSYMYHLPRPFNISHRYARLSLTTGYLLHLIARYNSYEGYGPSFQIQEVKFFHLPIKCGLVFTPSDSHTFLIIARLSFLLRDYLLHHYKVRFNVARDRLLFIFTFSMIYKINK